MPAASITYVGFGCALVGPLFAVVWFQREERYAVYRKQQLESIFVIGGFESQSYQRFMWCWLSVCGGASRRWVVLSGPNNAFMTDAPSA